MRLSKLTLSGFKSFADTTEFTFDQPITGIVGPNGCGKSNVVDAVKWVLGERSSKSLRGTEMLDVIFAGSAVRKPLGMASVKLSFENPIIDDTAQPAPAALAAAAGAEPTAPAAPLAEDTGEEESESAGLIQRHGSRRRGLPIDADMVEVERRLYRDGTSQYLINGRRARLRDIRELFLDTGIGADAYSIIEQGKVDAMLLASPQERRVIFEEAAGIAKYKQRRIEAQRKLDRAEESLRSTREALESTERRLRITRGQAAKARTFKELDSDLKAWRLALAFDQYDDLEQRLAGLTSRQSDLQGQRDESAAELARLESAKQDADLARQECEGDRRNRERDRMTAANEHQQAAQRRTILERSVEDLTRRAAEDESRLTQVTERAESLASEAADKQDQLAAAAEAANDADRALAQAASARSEVLERLHEKRSSLGSLQASAARIERERFGLLASISAEEKRTESLREQSQRLAAREQTLAAELDQQSATMQTLRQALEKAKEEAARAEDQITDTDDELARLGADRRERAAQIATLEQELVRADSRRATLEEMVQQRAGFGEAVRRLLAEKTATSGDPLAGVLAPLADLIEPRRHIEPDLSWAVEAALGEDLQALVVRSRADIPDAQTLNRAGGRVTFVSLAPFAGESPAASEPALPGLDLDDPASRIVSLRTLVGIRAGVAEPLAVATLLGRLLADTYLVDSEEAAQLLAAGPLAGRACRFVTRDGRVIDASGRITAGPATAAPTSGILQRRAELEALTEEVFRSRATLDGERAELLAVDADAAKLDVRSAALRAQLSRLQRQMMQDQSRLERAEADASRLERELTGVKAEASQLSERLTKLDVDRVALLEKAESLRRLHDEEAGRIDSLDQEARAVQAEADAALEKATQAKLDAGRLSERLQSLRRELSGLEMMRDDLRRQERDLKARSEANSARAQEQQAQIAQAAADAERFRAEEEEHARLLAEAKERLAACEAECAALGEKVHAARQLATAFERDWHSLEVARRELEVKRENLHERTLQDIGIDLLAEYPEYREMMSGGEIARIDPPRAALSIDSLREQIRKLGHVNLDAIEEEKNLETQNEELVRQVEDLDNARVQLIELIDTLNRVSRERFGEVFTRIQHHFGAPDGMFRLLFGGGKAEVRLMPLIKEIDTPDGPKKVETDEIDLLESGVEVIAKPPGKEPRAISQLSGGEKTLTAVALLMSIFRSKPSCFCVLDEVDAALDEANVGRFNGVIRQFTDSSHFIVITHNKRTMQSADQLYGVTMQERGVSTRVRVRFEQVGKDGQIEIKADARAPEPEAAEPRRRRSRPGSKPAAAEEAAQAESAVALAEPDSPIEEPGPFARGLASMREQDATSPAEDADSPEAATRQEA